MVGTCPLRDMTSDSKHKQMHGMALMLLFLTLLTNIQSIALYILLSIPMVMCRKWVVACGRCPFVAAILPRAPPLWCRRRSQEQAAHSADRSTWSSRALRAHYTSPPRAPRSPGSGCVEGKPARKPWVGAGTARSVDDVPCITIQMLNLLLSMNNYNLGALSTILM